MNFSMPANDVTATPMAGLIYYTLTYNNLDGAIDPNNPEVYSVETSGFTLKNPSKTGYVFV